ncbi:hypothetical protein D3C75_837310 [compost metagenome]
MAYRRPRLPAAAGHWPTTCSRSGSGSPSSQGVSQKRMPSRSRFSLASLLPLYRCEVAYTGRSPAYWKARVGLICRACAGVAARNTKSTSWRRAGWASTSLPRVSRRRLARASLARSCSRSAICWARRTGWSTCSAAIRLPPRASQSWRKAVSTRLPQAPLGTMATARRWPSCQARAATARASSSAARPNWNSCAGPSAPLSL